MIGIFSIDDDDIVTRLLSSKLLKKFSRRSHSMFHQHQHRFKHLRASEPSFTEYVIIHTQVLLNDDCES